MENIVPWINLVMMLGGIVVTVFVAKQLNAKISKLGELPVPAPVAALPPVINVTIPPNAPVALPVPTQSDPALNEKLETLNVRLEDIGKRLLRIDRGTQYELEARIAFDACAYSEQMKHFYSSKAVPPGANGSPQKWDHWDKQRCALDYALQTCKRLGLEVAEDALRLRIEAALGASRVSENVSSLPASLGRPSVEATMTPRDPIALPLDTSEGRL